MSRLIIIDDDDTAVTYSGRWNSTIDHSNGSLYSGSYHSTRDIGAQAILKNVSASRITVVSVIDSGNGHVSEATFTLDDGPNQYVQRPASDQVQYNVIFWDSGPLQFGYHTLEMTAAGNEVPFRIDRIECERPLAAAGLSSNSSNSVAVISTSNNTAAATSTTLTANNSTSTTLSSTFSTTPLPTADKTKQLSPTAALSASPASSIKSPPPWAIAVAVLGGMTILVCTVVIIVLRRRRRITSLSSTTPFLAKRTVDEELTTAIPRRRHRSVRKPNVGRHRATRQ